MSGNPLTIKLGLRTKQFESGLGRMKSKWSQTSKSMGSDLAKMGASAVAIGAGAFGIKTLGDQAASQDEAFANLADEIGATGKAYNKMRSDIYATNKALGLSDAKEAANRLYEVHRASGLAGAELKQLTIQTGQYAARWKDVGKENALKAQTTLLKEFGGQGVKVKDVGNALAFLASKTGDLRGEMGDTVGEYSVQLREAGFSFKESVAIFGEAITAGWSPDKAVDMFKETRIRLQGAENAAMQTLGKMGLSELAAGLKTGEVKVDDAMQKIRGKLKGLPVGMATQYGKEIFGAPFEDIGLRATTKMLEAMKKSPKLAGLSDKVAAQLGKRFSWRWNQSWSGMDNNFSRFLEEMKPILEPLVKKLGELSDWGTQFVKKYPNLTKTLAAGGVALSGMAIGVGALTFALTALTAPVGLTILGVAALSAGVVWLEQKTGMFSSAWAGLVEVMGPSLADIQERFGWVGDAMADAWKLGVHWIGVVVEELGGMKGIFKGVGKLFGLVIDTLFLAPLRQVDQAIESVGVAWAGFKNMLEQGFSLDSIKEFAGQALSALWEVFKAVAMALPGGGTILKIMGKGIPAAIAKMSPKMATAMGGGFVTGHLNAPKPGGQTPGQAPASEVFQMLNPLPPQMPPGYGPMGIPGPVNTYNIGAVYSRSRDASADLERAAKAGG